MKKQILFLIIACGAILIASKPFGILAPEYYRLNESDIYDDEFQEDPVFAVNYQYDSISDRLREIISYCMKADEDSLCKSPYIANVINIKNDSTLSQLAYELNIQIVTDEIELAMNMAGDTLTNQNGKQYGIYYINGIPNYIFDETQKFVGKQNLNKPVKIPSDGRVNYGSTYYHYFNLLQEWKFLVYNDDILLLHNRLRNFHVDFPEYAIPISLDRPLPEIPVFEIFDNRRY